MRCTAPHRLRRYIEDPALPQSSDKLRKSWNAAASIQLIRSDAARMANSRRRAAGAPPEAFSALSLCAELCGAGRTCVSGLESCEPVPRRCYARPQGRNRAPAWHVAPKRAFQARMTQSRALVTRATQQGEQPHGILLERHQDNG